MKLVTRSNQCSGNFRERDKRAQFNLDQPLRVKTLPSERLERQAGKRARAVLRGGGDGDTVS